MSEEVPTTTPLRPAPVAAGARNPGIDVLRGLVMVLMALDHTRDFVGSFKNSPTDLATTTLPLFFTRWITHYCAPTFVLLAGMAAALYGMKRSRGDLQRFLLTRGLWLMLLEVTVIRFDWMLNLNYHLVVLQVIWAIGVSMVALSGLLFLPPVAVAVFAVAMIALHNLLDGIHAAAFGRLGWLWNLLHERATVTLDADHRIFVVYPVIPWIAVLAAGYVLCGYTGAPGVSSAARRRRLFTVGVTLTAAFVVLRAINHYGDPHPWAAQTRAAFTVLSFLNCEKYPPSLAYLLMTLGPSLCALAFFDRPPGMVARWLSVIGRVPLFYYVAHLTVIHLVLAVIVLPRLIDPTLRAALLANGPGFGLPVVYAVWAVSVVLLYPLCRMFAGVKQRSKSPWMSYL